MTSPFLYNSLRLHVLDACALSVKRRLCSLISALSRPFPKVGFSANPVKINQAAKSKPQPQVFDCGVGTSAMRQNDLGEFGHIRSSAIFSVRPVGGLSMLGQSTVPRDLKTVKIPEIISCDLLASPP